MKYARIVKSTAVDVRTESPEGCFTPDVVAEFVEVPDQVEDGWTLAGGKWSAPVIPEPVAPPAPVVVPPKVSPVEFKLLFTSAERIAIKAARASDPVLEDAYEILEDPRLTHVDLSLASNRGLIDYLVSKSLVTAPRAEQIKAGKFA